MLNVIYVGDAAANSSDTEKEQYIDERLSYYQQFRLATEEKKFIKQLLMLISIYMDSVLLDEEYNTVTFARLLNFCPPEADKRSRLLAFVEDAAFNDTDIKKEKAEKLKEWLKEITPIYTRENVLLALQVLQVDYMLNPESSCEVSNLLNLAVLRCCSHEDRMLDVLYEKLCNDDYLTFVFPEFSRHSNRLMKNYREEAERANDKLLQYTHEKYRKLPNSVKEALKQYDFQLYLSYELFGESSDLRKLGTTRICGDKIRVWIERNKVIIDLSYYHEMGHVVDYMFGENGFCSRTDGSWKIIYDLEAEFYLKSKLNICPELKDLHEYGASSPTEYFASIFADYVERPEWLMEIAPNTYFFIDTLLE